MTSPSATPDLVRQERQALIETLRGLTQEQWGTRSLCTEWRVVDVAAHLAWAPTLGPLDGGRALLRSRLSVNRMIASSAVEWSRRGHEAILDQLERNAESGVKPIGMPTVAALADAVVHGIDVRRPLGLVHPLSAAVLAPVADFVLWTPWPLTGVVGGSASRRVKGVRLVAGDVGWAHGEGPEVAAAAEALVRLLYARPVSADELTGDGAAVVRARL